MAEKRKAQTAPDPARRARPGPTIDLTATEVPPPAPTPDPQPQSDTEPASAAAPEAAAPPPPEPPSVEAAPAADEKPPEPAAQESRRPGALIPLAAGFAGGLVAVAILAGLWYGGILPGTRAPDLRPELVKVEQQVAATQSSIQSLQAQTKTLQARTEALQNRPAPEPDTKAVDALAQRVAGIETALKDLPANNQAEAQLADRVAAAEAALKSNEAARAALGQQIEQVAASGSQAIGTAVTQLAGRVDELAKQRSEAVTPAQFEDLRKQVAALEQSTQNIRTDIAQNAAAASAARLSLAAEALRNAVLSHAPYQAELAQAQALGADPKQLAPLQPFAATGVPTDGQLAQSLRKLLPTLRPAAPPQASTSFLDRLRANAGRLVRITPANAPAGDDPTDVLARLDLEAEHADIDAGLRDLQKLPPEAQQKAAGWIATVKARNQALAAARAFASDTARALGGQ